LDCYGSSLEKGTPIAYCDNLADYAKCKNVVGEFYSIIPLGVASTQIVQGAKDMLSNPISLFGGLTSFVCGPNAFKPSPKVNVGSICRIFQLGKQGVESGLHIYEGSKKFIDLFGKSEESGSYCRQVINKYSKYVD
jgi:hypothetical protein